MGCYFWPKQCTAFISFVSNLNSQFWIWCARKEFNTVFLSKITEISISHCTTSIIRKQHMYHSRDSSVCIATCYGLDGPRIESRWRRDFLHLSRQALGPTQPRIWWLPSFPGVQRLGRGVDHPPPSSAEVRERVELYLYSPSRAFVACSRVNFTFTFTFGTCIIQLT
jgi:hypothetical protein